MATEFRRPSHKGSNHHDPPKSVVRTPSSFREPMSPTVGPIPFKRQQTNIPVKIPSYFLAALSRHSPFKYLPLIQRQELAAMSVVARFQPGDTLLKQDRENVYGGVYVITKGSVTVVDEEYNPPKKIAGGGSENGLRAIFGEREAALKVPNRYSVVADENGVECLLIPSRVFMALANVSKPFGSAVCGLLRESVKMFNTIEILIKEIESIVLVGEVNFENFKSIYCSMNSIMHPFCLDANTLDLNSLMYAVRRLPSSVSRTHLWILGRQRPEVLDPHGIMLLTSSPARRRAVWDMSNGMAFCLMSDALTDLVDMLCCICCYAVEAKKVRERLSSKHKTVGNVLFTALQKCEPEKETLQLQLDTLAPFFSEAELLKIINIWPTSAIRVCWEMLIHHENFSFKVQKMKISQVLPIDLWSEKIRLTALKMCNNDIENISVSLISSNTHSITNLISPWVHKNKPTIIEWGKKKHPKAFDVAFPHSDDLYLKEFPEFHAEKTEYEKKHGIEYIEGEFDGTGISVQLINPDLLDENFMDAAIPSESKVKISASAKTKRLIVNIDFAFGKQAETILDELILLFGTSIRSVNVFGKAGALVGKRGDILLPTHFIMFNEDNPKAVINRDVDFNRLVQLSNSHCDVWTGPVLTVLGTLVQNAEFLHYFEQLWHCIGLEMEGSYYSRAMERGIMRGLLLPLVKSRFLYYVSDLPLEVSDNLSRRLEPWEGIPPLYLISRAVIEEVLHPDSDIFPDHEYLPTIEVIDQTRFSPNSGAVSMPNESIHTLQEAAMSIQGQTLIFNDDAKN